MDVFDYKGIIKPAIGKVPVMAENHYCIKFGFKHPILDVYKGDGWVDEIDEIWYCAIVVPNNSFIKLQNFSHRGSSNNGMTSTSRLNIYKITSDIEAELLHERVNDPYYSSGTEVDLEAGIYLLTVWGSKTDNGSFIIKNFTGNSGNSPVIFITNCSVFIKNMDSGNGSITVPYYNVYILNNSVNLSYDSIDVKYRYDDVNLNYSNTVRVSLFTEQRLNLFGYCNWNVYPGVVLGDLYKENNSFTEAYLNYTPYMYIDKPIIGLTAPNQRIFGFPRLPSSGSHGNFYYPDDVDLDLGMEYAMNCGYHRVSEVEV